MVRFLYSSVGTVTTLQPSRGPAVGGTVVTLLGKDFDVELGEVECDFGPTAVVGRVTDGSIATCTAPSGSVGTVSLVVKQGGVVLGGDLQYEYQTSPGVLGMWPQRGGVAGGTAVTVRGSGFTLTGLQCRFGADVVEGAGASWMSSTMVKCVAPKRMGAQGPVSLEVSINDGADFTSDGQQYVYDLEATVEGVRPSQGIAGREGQ
eukprot:673802-Rhodomonas_salina.1